VAKAIEIGKGPLDRQRRTEQTAIRSTRALKMALAHRQEFSPRTCRLFYMALSRNLGGAGMLAQKLETTPLFGSRGKDGEGFSITKEPSRFRRHPSRRRQSKFDAASEAPKPVPGLKTFQSRIFCQRQVE